MDGQRGSVGGVVPVQCPFVGEIRNHGTVENIGPFPRKTGTVLSEPEIRPASAICKIHIDDRSRIVIVGTITCRVHGDGGRHRIIAYGDGRIERFEVIAGHGDVGLAYNRGSPGHGGIPVRIGVIIREEVRPVDHVDPCIRHRGVQ